MDNKRNYKKEWEKETKTIKLVKIDKELYKKLEIKLKADNKTFASFVKESILRYVS